MKLQNVKKNQVVITKNGNKYLIFNVNIIQGEMKNFTGQRITGLKTTDKYESEQYITWNSNGEDSELGDLFYTGNNVKEIVNLVHNQQFRKYGVKGKVFEYFHYDEDFKGVYELVDKSPSK